ELFRHHGSDPLGPYGVGDGPGFGARRGILERLPGVPVVAVGIPALLHGRRLKVEDIVGHMLNLVIPQRTTVAGTPVGHHLRPLADGLTGATGTDRTSNIIVQAASVTDIIQ